MEVDKICKVTLGGAQTCSVANIQAQLCVLWCDLHWRYRYRSCVKLASSGERVSEHKFKCIGFKSHVRLTLCLKYILYMIIYVTYIYSKYISYMCIGVSAYPQNTSPPSFFVKPLINQKIFKAPSSLPVPFSQFFPLYFGFLQSSLKSNFSVSPHNIFHP